MKRTGQRIVRKKGDPIDDHWSRPYNSFGYAEICPSCKKEHLVETQKDDHPEYYTSIYVKCDCGDFVEFELPVN